MKAQPAAQALVPPLNPSHDLGMTPDFILRTAQALTTVVALARPSFSQDAVRPG